MTVLKHAENLYMLDKSKLNCFFYSVKGAIINFSKNLLSFGILTFQAIPSRKPFLNGKYPYRTALNVYERYCSIKNGRVCSGITGWGNLNKLRFGRGWNYRFLCG